MRQATPLILCLLTIADCAASRLVGDPDLIERSHDDPDITPILQDDPNVNPMYDDVPEVIPIMNDVPNLIEILGNVPDLTKILDNPTQMSRDGHDLNKDEGKSSELKERSPKDIKSNIHQKLIINSFQRKDENQTASPNPEPNLVCGHQHLSKRINGGHSPAPHAWPSICGLMHVEKYSEKNGIVEEGWACGGTLVKNQQGRFYVITAAHCTGTTKDYRVKCGVHSLRGYSPYKQVFGVQNVIVHEDYVMEDNKYGWLARMSHDIAILDLAGTVQETAYVQAACLPSDPARPGERGVAAGWGWLTRYGQSSDLLQDLERTIESNKECEERFHSKTMFDLNCTRDGMLCAGPRGQGKGVCHGDSGGPLYTNRHGVWTLTGVTSFTSGCGWEDFDDGYTDVYSHLHWINSKINQRL